MADSHDDKPDTVQVPRDLLNAAACAINRDRWACSREGDAEGEAEMVDLHDKISLLLLAHVVPSAELCGGEALAILRDLHKLMDFEEPVAADSDCVSDPSAINALFARAYALLNRVTPSHVGRSDPLTLEFAEELFGSFLDQHPTYDDEHPGEYFCRMCECLIPIPGWITAPHDEGCSVAKARDYLALHKPECTPGFVRSATGEPK